MQTKKEATKAAKECLAKMKTKGWKISILENLGWHWKLTLGYIALMGSNWDKSEGNEYWTLMSDELPANSGSSYWPHKGYYKDPNKAVKVQIKAAGKFLRKIEKIVDKQDKLLERK